MPDQIPLQLNREGIQERDDERGGEGVVILGKRLFQYLHQRRAIIRGTAIVRGNTVIYAGPLIMSSLHVVISFGMACMPFILETVFIEKFKLHLASQFLKAHFEGPCRF